GFAQVGRTRIRLELRPQRVNDAIARQATLRSKAQQLHQLSRAQAGPALGGDLRPVDRDREPPQQTHAEVTGRVVFIDDVWISHQRSSLRLTSLYAQTRASRPGNVSGTGCCDAAR